MHLMTMFAKQFLSVRVHERHSIPLTTWEPAWTTHAYSGIRICWHHVNACCDSSGLNYVHMFTQLILQHHLTI